MEHRESLPGTIAFYCLLTYAGLLLFSINYLPIVPGLDASWAFALNWFSHGPEIFGKDIALTYGPLGYLAVPQAVGHNLLIATGVHTLVWCVLLYLLILLWESGSRVGAALFTAALLLSNRLYFDYWDYLLSAIALLTFLLLLKKPQSISLLLILAVTTGVSFLVKFTGFILVMLLLSIYTIARLLLYRTVNRRELSLLALVFASGPIACLIYYPSFTNLWAYIQGSMQMSSGYSTAMSLPTPPDLAWKAALLCTVFGVCIVVSLMKKWVSPAGAAMAAATGWVAFKHGYVRSEPLHAAMFFCFMIPAFAFLLAQIPFTRVRSAVLAGIFLLFSFFCLEGAEKRWPVWSRYWWSPDWNLSQAGRLLNWKQAVRKLRETSDDSFRTAVVNDYLPQLNHSRVLFFPWDVANGSRGSFTTVPLFAVQAYSSYTRYLDEQSAAHIIAASPPIDFVFLEWKSIDGRNPFLDVPSTWNALFSGFMPIASQGDTILLKRRSAPLPMEYTEVAKTGCPAETWVQVPQRNSPLALSLDLHLTLAGRAVTTLYQLGAVNLQVQTRSGLSVEIRVPPDVVSAPFPINYLPLNTPILNALWKDNLVADPIAKFRLTGAGLPYLRCESLRFYDVTGSSIRVL